MFSFFSMSSQVHNDSGNVDAITIKFFALAPNTFLPDPMKGFGIEYQNRYEKGHRLSRLHGEFER